MKKLCTLWQALCREHRVLAGVLVWLANWAPVPFALLTWRMGAMVWGAYPMIQIGLTYLNYRFVRRPWPLAPLGLTLAAATVAAFKIDGTLFCAHVSNDYLSRALPELAWQAGVVIVAVLTIGAMALKWKENRK